MAFKTTLGLGLLGIVREIWSDTKNRDEVKRQFDLRHKVELERIEREERRTQGYQEKVEKERTKMRYFTDANKYLENGMRGQEECQFQEAAKNFSAAEEALGKCLSEPLSPDEISLKYNVSLNKALSLYYMQSFQEAIEAANILLVSYPEKSELLQLKGRILFRMGDIEQAGLYFTKAFAVYSKDRAVTAFMHFCNKKYTAAIAIIEQGESSEEEIDDYELYMLKAISYSIAQRDYVSAIKYFTLALNTLPKDDDALRKDKAHLLVLCGKAAKKLVLQIEENKREMRVSNIEPIREIILEGIDEHSRLIEDDIYRIKKFVSACLLAAFKLDRYNFKCLKLLAEEGFSPAFAYLSEIYTYGMENVKADHQLSFELARRAHEDGCIFGTFRLGNAYAFGHGVAKNTHRATELYASVIDRAGYVLDLGAENIIQSKNHLIRDNEIKQHAMFALTNLGIMYFHANGVGKNQVLAYKIFKKVASKGCQIGLFNLAKCLLYGQGVEKNVELAIQHFNSIAVYHSEEKRAYIHANTELYGIYSFGLHGIQKDLVKAESCLQRIMNSGALDGVNYNALGARFYNAEIRTNEHGRVVIGDRDSKKVSELDRKKAFDCFVKAAPLSASLLMGMPNFNLGLCYYHGLGTQKNHGTAFNFFTKANDEGYAGASLWLGKMCYRGRGIEQNYGRAFNFFSQDADNPKACHYIGLAYYFGHGCPVSNEQARIWLQKAEDKKYKKSSYFLGQIFERGHGVPIDIEQARVHYEKGVSLQDENCLERMEVFAREAREAALQRSSRWCVVQ